MQTVAQTQKLQSHMMRRAFFTLATASVLTAGATGVPAKAGADSLSDINKTMKTTAGELHKNVVRGDSASTTRAFKQAERLDSLLTDGIRVAAYGQAAAQTEGRTDGESKRKFAVDLLLSGLIGGTIGFILMHASNAYEKRILRKREENEPGRLPENKPIV